MKKTTLLFITLTVSLLAVSFVDRTRNESITTGEISICTNIPSNATASFFIANSQATPMVRKNVDKLTAAEINSIKKGVQAMKDLAFDDPTSWIYQSAIHGTTRGDDLPSWNTCHRSDERFFFLAWHRMYVYFFERILRAKSGDSNLTLPYWDYQTNPILHPAYRNNAADNTLYDGSRKRSINLGGKLPDAISISINAALTDRSYYEFQSKIGPPHGSVHTAIGGNMGDVSTAANDPAFWLHHANIDRLWDQWLRMCDGRINPTDDRWLTKSFIFFDENGNAVTLSGRQVVQAASQLNYRYDFPVQIPCNLEPFAIVSFQRFALLEYADSIEISDQLSKVSFLESKSLALDNFVKEHKKLNLTGAETSDRFIIQIEGIEIEKLPEGIVEVYLNIPPGEKPSPASKSFVGLLDLFAVNHSNSHHNAEQVEPLELDASMTARSLKLKVEDFKKAEISFYVRGNSIDGKEVSTDSDLTVQNMNLLVEIAQR